MSADTSTPTDGSSAVTTDRIEDNVVKPEDGEVSLERAQEYRDVREPLLEDLEAKLDKGESEILEQS